MKIYTETERQEHIKSWKTGGLSKAAYAKSAGIFPTTFYAWTNSKPEKKKPAFVEISQQVLQKTNQEIVIEKGTITIRVPLSAGTKELQTVFTALEGNQ